MGSSKKDDDAQESKGSVINGRWSSLPEGFYDRLAETGSVKEAFEGGKKDKPEKK